MSQAVSRDVFGHTDSIGRFLKNISRGSKKRHFCKGNVQGFGSK